VASVPVSLTTGTYQYNFVAGGTTAWVAGTYTVSANFNATIVKTTFTYSTAQAVIGSGASASVLITANTPVAPGATVNLGVLSTGGSGTVSGFVVAPDGTSSALPAAKAVTGAAGAYSVSWAVSATAPTGGYLVYAKVANTTSGLSVWGLGSYTVAPAAAQQATLTTVATGVTGIQTGVTAIQTGVTSANGALTSLTSAVNNLNTAAQQINGLSAAIANNQTYVLLLQHSQQSL